MATLKFYLQSKKSNAPIYCRISLGGAMDSQGNPLYTESGKRKVVTYKRRTGLTCPNPSKWSTSKGLPTAKDESAKHLIEDLRELETVLYSQLNRDQAIGETIDQYWLENTIERHFGRSVPENLDYLTNYAEHYIKNLQYKVSDNGLGVKSPTLKKYSTILTKMKEFETYKGKRYLLSKVDLKLRQELIEYFVEVDGLKPNTTGRYIKFIKTFALDAQKNGHILNPQIKDFKGFTVKASKVVLSFRELDILAATKFENPILEAAKDWLIIGCYTGQRVSDLLRMNRKMISEAAGFSYILITQQKTGKTVQIPVHPKVEAILQKRGGEFPPVFAETAGSNSTLFNRHIKRVCQEAGINTQTEGSHFNSEIKRSEEGTFPKYLLVTSHICRRSFATNFYADSDYPTPILMNITGHSTEKMFLEYIGKPAQDYSIQLAKIWAKKNKEGEPRREADFQVIRTGTANE